MDQTIEVLQAENKKLKTENAKLKKKLGMSVEKIQKKLTIRKVILKKKIDKLSLNEKTVRLLNNNEIYTVEDLIKFDEIDLMRMKNIGVKTLTEIEIAVRELNLCLGQTN